MKKLLMVIPLVLLFCFTFTCQKGEEVAKEPEPVVDVEADIKAIKTNLDEWVPLYNAGDFESIMSVYYTEKSVRMPQDEPIQLGKEAILAAYKKSRDQFDEHCESSIPDYIRVSGDLAVAHGVDNGTNIPKDGGEPEEYNIKWVIVLERQPGNTWKWIWEIWNDTLPLPE